MFRIFIQQKKKAVRFDMEKNETCEIVQPELNNMRNSSSDEDSSSNNSQGEGETDEEEESEHEINNNNNNNNNNNKSIISTNKNKAVIKNPKRVMFANVMDATDLVVSSQQSDGDVTNKDDDDDSEDDQERKVNDYDKVCTLILLLPKVKLV